jgi:integrase
MTWDKVDLKRHMTRLIETKNWTARSVLLKFIALAALQEQCSLVANKPADPVFPRPWII